MSTKTCIILFIVCVIALLVLFDVQNSKPKSGTELLNELANEDGGVKDLNIHFDTTSVDDIVNQRTAASKGDTYCRKCGKFSEGKNRICPHCGQYID